MRILILCVLATFLATDARSQHSTAFLNITLTDIQSFQLSPPGKKDNSPTQTVNADEEAVRVLNLINSQIKRYDSRDKRHLVHYKKIASLFPERAFSDSDAQVARLEKPVTAQNTRQPLIIYEIGPR